MVNAPVALFVYNRLDKTEKVIEALKRNPEAKDTIVYIFADAPQNGNDAKVDDVRCYVSRIEGFNKIVIVNRDHNYGLAKNIIDGVSSVVNQFGKVIVLEDDIVVGNTFLRYMNETLIKYENEKKVMEISAYIEPIDSEGLPESMLIRNIYCWGWATWKDRWELFSRNKVEAYGNLSIVDKYHFDIEGVTGASNQLFYNTVGQLDTWAVYWYLAIFKNDGYVLVPNKSLVNNIGADGTGEHQASNLVTLLDDIDHQITEYPEEIVENVRLRHAIHDWYKRRRQGFSRRIYHFLRRRILYVRYLSKMKH